jgi:hypothetical protein
MLVVLDPPVLPVAKPDDVCVAISTTECYRLPVWTARSSVVGVWVYACGFGCIGVGLCIRE